MCRWRLHRKWRMPACLIGGETAVLWELAKYDTVEKDWCGREQIHFLWKCAEKWPCRWHAVWMIRVCIFIMRWTRFIRSKSDAYDLIIIDSPNPFGAEREELFWNFMKCLMRFMKIIMKSTSMSPFYRRRHSNVREYTKRIIESFPISRIYRAHIPSIRQDTGYLVPLQREYHPIHDMDGISVETAYWFRQNIIAETAEVFALPAYVEEY